MGVMTNVRWGVFVLLGLGVLGCTERAGDRGYSGWDVVAEHDGASEMDVMGDDVDGPGRADDAVGPVVVGSVEVAPAQLVFENVEIGTQQRKSLTIQNLGDAPLQILEITLQEEFGGAFDEEREFFTAGAGWASQAIVLESGASHQVEVAYRPLNAQPDRGAVVIVSDDPQGQQIRVPLSGNSSAPQAVGPRVEAPAKVVWPRLSPVTPGAGAPPWAGNWKMIEVKNTGDEPLALQDIEVEGSARFYYTIPRPTSSPDETPDVNEDTMSWPGELSPGQSLRVRVWFRPVDDAPEQGKLVLRSNDPTQAAREVQLLGNGGEPCLSLNPESLVSFGPAAVGAASQQTVTLHNCSANSVLKIREIRLLDDAFGALEIPRQSLPAGLPAEEHALNGAALTSFDVVFRPMSEGTFEGEILVVSNDLVTPEYRLRVEGRGVARQCPTAVAVASVEGQSGGSPGSSLVTRPLSTIRLDGSRSTAPNGRIQRYEWTLLSSPRDSNEVIRPAGSATPTLFLDMVGEYKIELKVYDEQNMVSCGDPMIISILSRSEKDILIQISWETPGHPQAYSGGAADVDLHYLHPNASRWNAAPWDCYYANKAPRWAPPSSEYGNPTLDIDRISTGGPENISHSRLEPVIYKAGVFYYSDHGHGPSYVTARIFRNGVEVHTREDRFLTNQQFWDVARIDGRTLNITPIDVTTQGYPEN